MSWIVVLILVTAAILLWAWIARRILDNPFGDVEGGLLWVCGSLYVRLFHGLRIVGREHIPRTRRPGPLIIVSNHTAGIDPMLVQVACPFPIRWMMALDMRIPALEWFWKWARIIDVDREAGAGIGPVRDAIRHVRRGGVLGLFPEGQLERPKRHLLPFQSGVGAMVQRTGALVLPVVIDGTPTVDPAWASLWHPSRSTIEFKPPIDYTGADLSAEQIADDLRRRYQEWTGWPMASAKR